MYSQTEKLFLNLLQQAIWDSKPDPSLFEGLAPDVWKKIMKIALQQTSSALIADRILLLPPSCLPPSEDFIFQLMALIRTTEKINRKMSNAVVNIQKSYDSLDIPFVLVKGLANATNYPNPLLRNPGDIDLFLYQEGDYEKANQWVKEQGYVYHVDDRDGHRAFEINEFMFENHKLLTFFERKKHNDAFKKIIAESLDPNRFDEICINNEKIKTLPPDLNALYIFIHFFFHFIHGGVGVRQFCDWILFLAKHHHRIDNQRFEKWLDAMDLLRPAQLFGLAAVEYLGATPSIFPFALADKSKYSEKIMEEIMRGGNFGFHHQPYKKRYKTWTRRALIFANTLKKVFLFAAIAPSYMWVIPIVSLRNRAKKTLLQR